MKMKDVRRENRYDSGHVKMIATDNCVVFERPKSVPDEC